jgi:translocator assembly and maintenance protein 41
VSLSLLPQKFKERHLYETLTALSYKGDFRGYIGAESKTKINDIVDAQMHLFRDLYQPLLRELSDSVHYEEFSGYIHQDKSPEATRKLLCTLPENLKLNPNVSPERTQDQVNKIILRPSIVQALKGLLTAGLWTSFKYALRKVQKGLQKSK